jgi:hypothetical protein
MVCFRYIIVNTLHKVDMKDNNNNNNNNSKFSRNKSRRYGNQIVESTSAN